MGITFGWFVGMFDGEGCICVLKHRRKHGVVFYTLNIAICNNSMLNLRAVQKQLDQVGIKSYIYNRTKDERFDGIHESYVLKITTKDGVRSFLQLIKPYVVGKYHELVIALWFLDRQCAEEKHVITTEERRALDLLSDIKRNAGHVPDELAEELISFGIPLASPLI